MDRRLEPCTFGQGSNPLNNKFSILCTVMNSNRFMNSSEQYRFMNSDRYFGKYQKKSIKTRNFAEKIDKKPKFRRTDNRKGISCRDAPIHEISADISDFSNLGFSHILFSFDSQCFSHVFHICIIIILCMLKKVMMYCTFMVVWRCFHQFDDQQPCLAFSVY